MNLYPEQLRQLAAMCETLNQAEDLETPSTGMSLMFAPIEVTYEDGVTVGTLRDEVGGSWSFFPKDALATGATHG